MRQHDQQGTPWSQNWAEFKSAVKGEPRGDGRNRLMAILHEGLNAFLVEPVRKYPKISGFILLFLLVALLDCRLAIADDYNLTWTPPTERTDGTALPQSEILGYEVYINGNPLIDLAPGDSASAILTLDPGDNAIRLKTVDTGNRKSAFSNEKIITIATPIAQPPNPPVIVNPGDVAFGPVTIPTEYVSTPEIKAATTIVVKATLNSVGTTQGLFSRDENGQADSGHTTIIVLPNGIIEARNQGLTETLTVNTVTPVETGVPFTLTINIAAAGFQVSHDGVIVGYNPGHYPLAGNDLPLFLGAECIGCDPSNRVPANPIDGVVSVELFE